MKYERVGFNDKWILGFETVEDFVFDERARRLWPETAEETREARLREVYSLVKQIHENN